MEPNQLKWEFTKKALNDLENLLKCEACGKCDGSPACLGSCEHFFCRHCVENLAGNECPICHVPSHVKDVQTNRQLTTAVTLCHQLKELLTLTDSNGANIAQMAVEDLGDPGSVPENSKCSKVETSVNEMKVPALRRNTRKVTAKKRKKENIQKMNNQWDIGKNIEDTSQCFSCTKDKKAKPRVSFGQPSKQCDTADVASEMQDEERGTSKSVELSSEEGYQFTDLVDMKSRDRRKSRTCITKSLKNNEVVTVIKARDCDGHSSDTSNSIQKENYLETIPNQNEGRKRKSQEKAVPLATAKKEEAESEKKMNKAVKNSKQCPKPNMKSKLNEISTQPWPSPDTSKTGKRQLRVNSPVLNSPIAMNKRNAKGETQLHVATIKGDLKRVVACLKDGANTNTKDNAGWTPLHEACNHGYKDIASQLLDHGAHINMPGLDNDTPLHDAVQNGRIECVQLLVSRGASLTTRNIHGYTAVDLAKTQEMKKALETPIIEEAAERTVMTAVAPQQMISQIVLLPTGLSREQKIKLQKCADLLHGKVVQEFGTTVSHLVTGVNAEGMCPRTLKYLQGILTGKWIVNFEWAETCIEYKTGVNEEAFEVPGASSSPDSYAPRKSRTNKEEQLPGIFDGCNIFLKGEFSYPTPTKDQMTQFIKLGGGHVMHREPKLENIDEYERTIPYHARQNSPLVNCGYFIINDNRIGMCSLQEGRLCTAPASWLLDCIAKFEFVDFPTEST